MFKAVLPVIFLASSICMFGNSTGVSPCSTGTLSTYNSSYAPTNPGSPSCSIGILDYSNFSYQGLQNAPAESSILVTPISGTNGFDFSQVGGAPFSAVGDVVQFAIYYNIFIDPAPVIPSADTHLDPPVGNVSVTQYFCNDSVLYPGTITCFPPTSTAYSLTVTTASPDASIVFPIPATSFQTTGLIFTLNGINGAASFDGLMANTQVTAPEPASILLFGLAMVAAGGYKLKKQRKN